MKYSVFVVLLLCSLVSEAAVVFQGKNPPPKAVQMKMAQSIAISCPETMFNSLVISDTVTLHDQVSLTENVVEEHYSTLFVSATMNGPTFKEFAVKAVVRAGTNGEGSEIEARAIGCK